ncbi:hypothetical protein [Actinomycetospora chiangmaiensis]|uniref:hypothetical protein n=1 Tax=Actinomycetospora chiangmaiensis TaxID=402650 RepID=UPI0003A3B504|nr:hypothetical protein [Actinomycetospora chiangmaiensis]
MSIRVEPDDLAETVTGFPVAHLLTVGGRPRPHVGSVRATVTGGTVRVDGVGRTALGDVARDAAVTLLWTPAEPGEYSLIVDGSAAVSGDGLVVTPHRAVLHRPAAAPGRSAAGCAADCRDLPVDG